MVGAILLADGSLHYVAPQFELETLRDYWTIEAPINAWEEHESPYHVVGNLLGNASTVLVDEVTPFFTIHGLQAACPHVDFRTAQPLTQACRSKKSKAELAILQRAHEMTLAVQQATATILRPGISSGEVTQFIDEAHRKVGAPNGSSFCIVLFGVATSFPHGVKDPQTLADDDWVLIDTGCFAPWLQFRHHSQLLLWRCDGCAAGSMGTREDGPTGRL